MEGLFLAFMWAVERVRSPILGSIMAGILITLVIFSGLAIVFVVLKDLLPSIDVMSLFYGAVLLGYPLGVSLGVCYIAQRRRQGGSPRRAVLGAILGLTLAIVLLGYDDLAMRLGFELPEWTIAVALLISLFLIPLLATLGFNPALRWTSRLDELHPDEAEWLRECVLGLDPDKPEEQIRKELEEYLKLNPPHWIRSWGTHVYECPSCSALNKENVITAYCWNCKEWIAKAKVVPNPYRVPNGEAKAPAPKQLDSEPKHLVCLECHALNPPSSGYCDECGEELGLASAALPDSTVQE